jgi:hypothetical protein
LHNSNWKNTSFDIYFEFKKDEKGVYITPVKDDPVRNFTTEEGNWFFRGLDWIHFPFININKRGDNLIEKAIAEKTSKEKVYIFQFNDKDPINKEISNLLTSYIGIYYGSEMKLTNFTFDNDGLELNVKARPNSNLSQKPVFGLDVEKLSREKSKQYFSQEVIICPEGVCITDNGKISVQGKITH